MLLVLILWNDLAAIASWNPEFTRLEMFDGVKIEKRFTSWVESALELLLFQLLQCESMHVLK